MRVTFILPAVNMSGGARVLAIYAQRLQQLGHHVTVVSAPPQQALWRRRIKDVAWRLKRPLRQNIVAAIKRRKEGPEPNISHFDDIDVPLHIIDRFRPIIDDDVPDSDVVIATWWETAEWVAELSRRKGAKAYFIQHYEVFDYTPAKRVKATWHMPLHKIVVAEWLAKLAAREYGDHNAWLVPNAVDTDQFFAAPRARQKQPTVGLLYSTVKWKGVDVSLRAIRLAQERVPGLRLVVFGAEPIADQLPLPPGTSFYRLPEQDSIRDLYASCDVWLCGSYSEGFGLPALEAMACRCPVISTDSGGPNDFIKSGWNGYLVPVGDAEALADRLVGMFSLDESEWRAMSDAALATATQYTWGDATELLESALYEIVRSYSGKQR